MSSSGLKDQIQDAMKTAMKGGDKERLAVIRLMMAAMKPQRYTVPILVTTAPEMKALTSSE